MKLFISFSGLLSALSRNEVSDEDLQTGLFYFGCVRSHAFELDERYRLKNAVAAHEKLVQALTRAEEEGRCRWHRPEPGVWLAPYSLLNELLVANGLSALPLQEDGAGRSFEEAHYGYPRVRELMEQVPQPRAEVLF